MVDAFYDPGPGAEEGQSARLLQSRVPVLAYGDWSVDGVFPAVRDKAEQNAEPLSPSAVLAVPSDKVDEILQASNAGRLTLALRSPADEMTAAALPAPPAAQAALEPEEKPTEMPASPPGRADRRGAAAGRGQARAQIGGQTRTQACRQARAQIGGGFRRIPPVPARERAAEKSPREARRAGAAQPGDRAARRTAAPRRVRPAHRAAASGAAVESSVRAIPMLRGSLTDRYGETPAPR